jgi:hypothetical protein
MLPKGLIFRADFFCGSKIAFYELQTAFATKKNCLCCRLVVKLSFVQKTAKA